MPTVMAALAMRACVKSGARMEGIDARVCEGGRGRSYPLALL